MIDNAWLIEKMIYMFVTGFVSVLSAFWIVAICFNNVRKALVGR